MFVQSKSPLSPTANIGQIMNLDLQVEGRHSQRIADLQKLHQREALLPISKSRNGASVTILRILTIIAAIFFSLLTATTLRTEVAFISIILILFTAAAIFLAAEKIIYLLPENLWAWRDPSPRG